MPNGANDTCMKYFLIAGEASGDLHASRLMYALREADPQAEFRFYGGEAMQAVGGKLLCHYRTLAYMGFVAVAAHLPTILRGLVRCRRAIETWRPDAVILVDYPGFNLKVAKYVRRRSICPVYYYISPKIWAWKERRIRQIRRDVTRLYSILPFEVDFFEGKHHYAIDYVGNPTVDEVADYTKHHGRPQPDGRTIALLPGSRLQEIGDNLSRMLLAAAPMAAGGYRLAIAAAPAVPRAFYDRLIARSGMAAADVDVVEGQTYALLSKATAALVTSGTATLETALFGVPQVVCYYVSFGRVVSLLRRLLLKVPYVSLVNLVAGREVVPELIADGMTAGRVREALESILPGGACRDRQLTGYAEMAARLGEPGAPQRAAAGMLERLRTTDLRRG